MNSQQQKDATDLPVAGSGRVSRLVIALPVLLVIALIGVLLSVQLQADKEFLIDKADRHTTALATSAAQQLDRALRSVDSSLKIGATALAAVKTPYETDAIKEQLRQILVRRTEANKVIRGLIYIDTEGYMITDEFGRMPNRLFLGDRDYYRYFSDDADRNNTFLNKPVRGRRTGTWFFAMSRRVMDDHGKWLGVIAAVVHPEYLANEMAGLDPVGDRMVLLVNDQARLYVASPFDDKNIDRLVDVRISDEGEVQLLQPGVFGLPENERWVGHQAQGDYFGLKVLAVHSADQVLRPWWNSLPTYWSIAGIATLGLLTLMVLVMRQVRRQNSLLTEQAKLIAEAKRTQAELSDYASISADWYWATDEKGRFTSVTGPFVESAGIFEEDLLGKTRLEVAREADPSFEGKDYEKSVNDRVAFSDFQYALKVRTGDVFWVSISGRPIYDNQGNFQGFRGTGREVTQQVLAQRAVEEERDRAELAETMLRDAIDATADGFIYCDADDRIVLCNKRYREMYELTPEAVRSGMTFSDLIDITVHSNQFVAAFGNEADWKQQRLDLHTRADGVPFEQELSDGRWVRATEQRSRSGGVVGFRADITELKQREAELKSAQIASDAANRAKSDFLATMSHEIRTPMNGVLGAAQLLLEEPALNDESVRLVNLIKMSGSSMLTLLNDILDLSKLEAGRVELDASPFALKDLLHQVTSFQEPSAKNKGLEISLNLDEGLPTLVKGDRGRIEQVLNNLCNNAIKFTEQGAVSLFVTQTPTRETENADKTRLRFEVMDTGIGVSPRDVDRLFQRFQQAEGSTRRAHGGSGLGLAICKNLVDLMGGEINVVSQLDRGSTFWFEIELETADEMSGNVVSVAERTNFVATDGEGRLVLLAEDNRANQLLTVTLLEKTGYEVHVAENGRQAVQKAAQRRYDLILMDWMMPEMDGIDATKSIRSIPGPNQDTPILALTANTGEDNSAKCLSVGMDDFITKPIDVNDLRRSVQSWAQERHHSAVAS